jgi:glucokinase
MSVTNHHHHVGVDLGGTHLRAAVVDTDTGEIVHQQQVPTLSRQGHSAVTQRMAQLIEDVIAASGVPKAQVGGIGIGAPGMLDTDRGLVLFLPNLPGHWLDVPLQQRIQEQVQLPTHLLNDAAYDLGEWTSVPGAAGNDGLFATFVRHRRWIRDQRSLEPELSGAAGERATSYRATASPAAAGGCGSYAQTGDCRGGMKAAAQLTTRLGEIRDDSTASPRQ